MLKVFLENGQTRSFRYDSNTTAEVSEPENSFSQKSLIYCLLDSVSTAEPHFNAWLNEKLDLLLEEKFAVDRVFLFFYLEMVSLPALFYALQPNSDSQKPPKQMLSIDLKCYMFWYQAWGCSPSCHPCSLFVIFCH